jgi:hypothetical protein
MTVRFLHTSRLRHANKPGRLLLETPDLVRRDRAMTGRLVIEVADREVPEAT